MPNYHQVTDNWIGNVTRGEKHRERYEQDVFWFRGNILFKHNEPVMRLEKCLDGSWLSMRTYKHWGVVYLNKVHNGRWLNRTDPVPTLTVENIGVHWSHNAKGALQGRDLHHFMHRQFMAHGEGIVDWAHRMGIQRMERYGVGALITMAMTIMQEHGDYRRRLCPDLPGIMDYSAIVRAVCDKRLGAYNEPKRKLQRERNAARKLAKKTLGL